MAGKLQFAGQESQATEQALEQLCGFVPDAVVIVDCRGHIVRINRLAEELFGYAQAELVDKPLEVLVPEPMRNAHKSHRERYCAQPRMRPMGCGFELLARRKDGTTFPVDIMLNPFCLGGETLVVSAVRDITERKRTAEALSKQARLLDAVIESMTNGLVVVDSQGKCLIFNHRAQGILGIGPPQEPPEAWPEKYGVYLPDMRTPFPVHKLPLVRALHGESSDEVELWIRNSARPAGVWIKVTASPLRDENGGVHGAVSVIRDVTVWKRMEAELEASRIQMIASARLSALGAMAANVAHEVNNPVAIIHALASDLLRSVSEEGASSYLGLVPNVSRIRDAAERIAKIVKSLGRIGRMGAMDKFCPVPVNQVVEQTLELCRERFRFHSIELKAGEIDPELYISCREVQISEVLLNLLQNAFDAVLDREGERWVRVGVTVLDTAVKVSVTDSGPGVPSELRDKIIQPFFTTKVVGKGAGLGLSLSKTIAEEHGGRLELGEDDGHTCFSLILPAPKEVRVLCG